MASFLPAPIGSGHPRRVPGPGVGRLRVQPYHTQPARCAQAVQAAALFLAPGFMRDVPTRREQPASAAGLPLPCMGWGSRGGPLTWQGAFGVKDPFPGRFVRLPPVQWGGRDGMIVFVMLWAFALHSSKSAPEALIAPC